MTGTAGEVGLRYARTNVLISAGGEVAGLYRLAAVNYPLLAVGDKWLMQQRLERLVRVIGADFSLWRVTRGTDSSPSAPESHTAEVYIAVSLRPAPRRALLASGDRVRARLTALSGGRPAAITGRGLAAMAHAEQRTFECLRALVELRRARTRELEWLLRRTPLRGVSEPRLECHWQPDALVIEGDDGGGVRYEPLGWDVWRLVAVPLREDPEYPPALDVEGEDGTSYQAMLCLGALADEAVFPGSAELLHAPLEAVGFAVDAALHARWVANRDALGQVRRRIVDAEQVYRDQLESRHGPAWRAEDDRTLAREYEQVLRSSARPAMLYATVSLAVGADSRDELERRVQTLRAAYGDVELFRPRGLQERLFFDHLPRADGGRVADYRQQLTAQQFGAMVPTATTVVGDRRGYKIGYAANGPRRAVRYDSTARAKGVAGERGALGRDAGVGQDDGGAADRLPRRLRREHGGGLRSQARPRVHEPLCAHGQVQLIELTGAEEQEGALDPLRIGVGGTARGTRRVLPARARARPAGVLGARDRQGGPRRRTRGRPGLPAGYHRLARARRARRSGGRRCAGGRFRAGARAARLQRRLPEMSSQGRAARAVTTVRAPGLTLPEPGVARETYTRAERVSVATLSLVAALALRLVSRDRGRHKVVLLDEAWFLLASAQGRALVNRLVRLGRAFNATVLLVTQRLDDVEAISDLVGTWFMFGQDSDAEATRALELIGVEPTPARVEPVARGAHRQRPDA